MARYTLHRIAAALEAELVIDQLAELQAKAVRGSEADLTYVEQQLDETFVQSTQDDAGIEDDVTATDESTDGTPVDDGSTPSDEADAVSEPADGAPAVEYYRSMTVATEDVDWDRVRDNVGTGATAIGGALLWLGRHLKDFGVAYGPIVLSKLYHGVVYVMSKLLTVTVLGLSKLAHYIDRRQHSFKGMSDDIAKLRRQVSEYASDGGTIHGTFAKARPIAMLKIGTSVDVTRNLNVADVFLKSVVTDLASQIDREIQTIRHVITYGMQGVVKVPTGLLVSAHPATLRRQDSPAYPVHSDLVETYQYPHVLPGDSMFVAHIPKSDIADDELAQAINQSSMFLGLHADSVAVVHDMPLLDVHGLGKLLETLQSLCDTAMHHQRTYERIMRSKTALKLTIRDYLSHLLRPNQQISVRTSMLDTVTAKQIYVDRVYLAGMIDLHDYIAKVIGAGIQYAQDHTRHYREPNSD